MALSSEKGRDYNNPPPGCAFTWKTCDDPGPAIDALSHGRLNDFFDLQPFLGPVTIVARAPVVAAVRSAGGDVTAQYRWGALVCLLAAVALGIWLALIAARRGLPFWVQGLIAVGAVLNPVTFATLKWGHPEEVVTAAFAVAALICASRRRPLAAGILLGLAIGAKAWALIAIPALLLVLEPAALRRGLAAVVITTGVLMAPMALGSPTRFHEVTTEVGKLGSQLGTETPANLMWPVATVKAVNVPVHLDDGRDVRLVGRAAKLPVAVARAARLVVFAAALLFAFLWWRRGGAARPESVLLLLALTLLVRGLFDPSNHSYYHAGPLLALLGYETLTRRAFPFATAAFMALFELTNRIAGHFQSFEANNRIYLAWAVPFAIYKGWELLSHQSWNSSASSSRSETSPRLAGATTPPR
jgi:alpha-1,6-mannosyltransferase